MEKVCKKPGEPTHHKGELGRLNMGGLLGKTS